MAAHPSRSPPDSVSPRDFAVAYRVSAEHYRWARSRGWTNSDIAAAIDKSAHTEGTTIHLLARAWLRIAGAPQTVSCSWQFEEAAE